MAEEAYEVLTDLQAIRSEEQVLVKRDHVHQLTTLIVLSIFYSGIECIKKDWVRFEVPHYPLHAILCLTIQTRA